MKINNIMINTNHELLRCSRTVHQVNNQFHTGSLFISRFLGFRTKGVTYKVDKPRHFVDKLIPIDNSASVSV